MPRHPPWHARKRYRRCGLSCAETPPELVVRRSTVPVNVVVATTGWPSLPQEDFRERCIVEARRHSSLCTSSEGLPRHTLPDHGFLSPLSLRNEALNAPVRRDIITPTGLPVHQQGSATGLGGMRQHKRVRFYASVKTCRHI